MEHLVAELMLSLIRRDPVLELELQRVEELEKWAWSVEVHVGHRKENSPVQRESIECRR